jgi:hypothetical protein
MLRVRVEIVPFGVESNSREIGQMVIANDGTGDSSSGNYVFVYSDTHGEYGEGTIKDFSRADGFWKLVSECLSNPGKVDNEELNDLLWERMK